MSAVHLTPMEKAIVAVLEEADGPTPYRDIYAAATGTPVAYAGRSVAHICNLRHKGVAIAHCKGRGYWLVERPEIAPKPGRIIRAHRVVVDPKPLFAALEQAYNEMLRGRVRRAVAA